MVTPAESRVGTFTEPPCPLPPNLRSDIAYRRAQGHRWEAIGVALNYHSNALRQATENDPEFAAAQEKAWAEATFEGEAHAMGRLRLMVNSDDEDRALRAAEVLIKYARERRRDDTRLAVEKMRAEAQHAKIEARAAEKDRVEELPPPMVYHRETPEERAAECERIDLERATKPDAEVYLWGGKHSIGRFVPPSDSDARVRVVPDWSCGIGARNVVFWIVPHSVRERVSGTGVIFPEDNCGEMISSK